MRELTCLKLQSKDELKLERKTQSIYLGQGKRMQIYIWESEESFNEEEK